MKKLIRRIAVALERIADALEAKEGSIQPLGGGNGNGPPDND